MHQDSSQDAHSAHPNIIELRQLARRLHKAAMSDSPAKALPVLRRLLSQGCIAEVPLTQLFKQRSQIRRKHLLRLLAAEAGYDSWERYSAAIPQLPVDAINHFDLISRSGGYPNHWFSDIDQARDYAREHGGQVIAVGVQAVVVPLGQGVR